MSNAIWKDIKGFEGYYQVSNTGEVRSVDRVVWSESRNQYLRYRCRVLKPMVTSFGYKRYHLYKCGLHTFIYEHRLIAEAFIPNPDNLPEIDHINHIRTDNRIENLRWVSHIDNMNNRIDNIPKDKFEEHTRNYRKQYYQEHKEEITSRCREWVKNNKDRTKQLKHEYYMRHRTSTMDHNNLKTQDPDYHKKYYAAHKELFKKIRRDFL